MEPTTYGLEPPEALRQDQAQPLPSSPSPSPQSLDMPIPTTGLKRKMTATQNTVDRAAKKRIPRSHPAPEADQRRNMPHIRSKKGIGPKSKPGSGTRPAKQDMATSEARGCPEMLKFIDDDARIGENEQKVASYLGFEDTQPLRNLCMSFPLLKAFRRYLIVFKNHTKLRAFELIRDKEEAMLAITEYQLNATYPIATIGVDDGFGQECSKRVKQDQRNRSYQLAWLLLQLEKDLVGLTTLSDMLFATLQMEEETSFRRDLPQLPVPHNTFKHIDSAVLPTLSYDDQEHRLERMNRCMVLLKYMRYQTANITYWKRRFSADGLQSSTEVRAGHVVAWMRESGDETSNAPT